MAKSNRQSRHSGRGDSAPRVDPQETARLLKAMPPNAPEAEMALLGSMLVEPGVIGDVVGINSWRRIALAGMAGLTVGLCH